MNIPNGLTIESRQFRYLLAGGWNTCFGYATGLFVYYLLHDNYSIVLIGILTNIAAITMAFVTHKLFVFRTKGNWLAEYLRSYLVYGVSAIIGIAALWLLVEQFLVPFWLAQLLVILATVGITYIGHSRITFR